MADSLDRLVSALAGRYAIEGELGSGGMATVYLAHDLKHPRRVAIKVLKPEIAATSGPERFLREINLTAGLTHPHIMPLLDSGEADGLPFFVMPFVEGETLRKRLEREGQLPLEDALRIAGEVADALSTAHAHGIVHRDIKPENILLEEGHAVVADFGLGRVRSEIGSRALTSAGLALGTVGYMSPEQATAAPNLDHRCDVYGLGCVLYEMLVGEPPFTGPTRQAVIARQLALPVPSVSLSRDSVSPALDAVVQRALAKTPADRFQTAAEFASALESAATQTAAPVRARHRIPARTTQRLPPLSGRRSRIVAAVLLAVVTAASVFALAKARGGRVAPAADAPEVVAVIPMRNADTSPAEEALAVDLAGVLAWQLNSWDTHEAVSPQALHESIRGLGLAGPALETLSDALDAAAAGRATTLVTLTAELHGDTARVRGLSCDVARRCETALQLPAEGPSTDPSTLAAVVTHRILGLSGPTEEIEALHQQTAKPAAVKSYLKGLSELASGQLQAAVTDLRAAIRADSTFSAALHSLAVAMYWNEPQDPDRGRRLAEIGRLAAAAERHSRNLAPDRRNDVQAFHRFRQGDYDGARAIYQAILERDSADIYAWLLLGAVECDDPWLAEQPDGSLRPAGNLNLALRAFERAVEISPEFSLGYGHLFAIHRRLSRSMEGVGAIGFLKPGLDRRVSWDAPTPASMLPFQPIVLDSIVWIAPGELPSIDWGRAERSAAALEERSLRLLQRWAEFARHDARPREELAEWRLTQRSRLRQPTPPEEIRSVTRQALASFDAALGLRRDTTPSFLQRLANLRLADDPAGAARLADSAIERWTMRPDSALGGLTRSILNLLTSRGQVSRALGLVDRLPVADRYIVDPAGGEGVAVRDAEPVILRLRILAATGIGGAAAAHELDSLTRLWPEHRYARTQIRLLKDFAVRWFAPLAITAGQALRDWVGDEDIGVPVWRAMEDEPAGRSGAGRGAASHETGNRELGLAERSYIAAHAASRSGDHTRAVRLFSRLDSLAFAIDDFDPGWGLRNLSFLYRAREYESLGDRAKALEYYELSAKIWVDADSLMAGLLDEARQGIARTRSPAG